MTDPHEEMIQAVVAEFCATFGAADDMQVAMAPGRVNLIGEYTDFNDGFVLPMTVDRGVYVAIRPRSDERVRVRSVRYGETAEYTLNQFVAPEPGSWTSYVFGVVEEFRRRGLLTHGVEAVVDGNLNLGAGLSSSAAIEMATAVALQALGNQRMDPVELVKLCQYVEHHYANVLCGIMDQYACGIGRRDHALLLDCRSLEAENIPLFLDDYQIVIVNSEVERSLASSAYNERRAECQEGVAVLARHDAGIRALRDVDLESFDTHAHDLSPIVRRRCRHVITENQRTIEASAALKSGDLAGFGQLMNESHRSLRDDFEVSCRELDALVDIANGCGGTLGSRMTGAGFGGCTVSLVHKDEVADFLGTVKEEYETRFSITPGVFPLSRNLEAGLLEES